MARPYDHALQAKRDREYERTSNAAELAELEQKWAREDSAAEAVADWRTRETLELKRRLGAVEKAIGPDGRRIVDALVGAIGTALRRVREEERRHVDEAISKALGDAAVMRYAGVWSTERSYPAGTCVTTAGSMWIATGPCAAGDKPGHDPAWRLCVKR